MSLKTRYMGLSMAAKTSLWFTVCTFLQRGTALITVPVFTRLLTTEQYGICNIYFAWFDIFLLFTSFKIPYEGLNNGLIRYEKEKDAYTSSVLGLIFVTTLISGSVYWLFHQEINRITGLNNFLMVLMFIQLFFNPSLMLWINRERFDFRYRMPVLISVFSTIFNLVVTILAVITTNYKTEARIISSVFVQSFFGLLMMIVLLKKGRKIFSKVYWGFAIKFNLPLIFYYISQIILSQSDRVMINYFQGSEKTALYSVAYSAATIIQLFVSSVNGSFNPWMYKKIKECEFCTIRSTSKILCMCVAGATLALSSLAPDLIRILATEEYMEAIWVIVPVSTSVFFIFLYMLFANVQMYYGENCGISIVSIVCSLLNLILNLFFIPEFGYVAAGWTTLISYMVLTLFHYILMKRAYKLHGVEDKVFDDRGLFLIICGELIGSVGVLFLYKLGNVRYFILVFGVIPVFVYREKIKRVISQMRLRDRLNERSGKKAD